MEKTDKNPFNYLASLLGPEGEALKELDRRICEAHPHVSKTVWEGVFWGGSQQEIVGYGDYTYKKSNKKEAHWFIVGMAVQKNYMSVYVNAVEDRQYLTEQYKERLGKVKVGKSSISFKKLSDVDMDVLMELIDKAFLLML